MGYELKPPTTPEEWRAFHDIREAVLWTARGKSGYNRRHEDDYGVPGNIPLLLTVDGRGVGCLRLDDKGDGSGIVRLVAISVAEQGRGHGRVMSGLWEDAARARGIETLFINAAPKALGYYEKLGWTRHVWDPAELAGAASDCVQMRKLL